MKVKSIFLLVIMLAPTLVSYYELMLAKLYLLMIFLPAFFFALVVDPIRNFWNRLFRRSRVNLAEYDVNGFIENIFSYWVIILAVFGIIILKYSAKEWIMSIL